MQITNRKFIFLLLALSVTAFSPERIIAQDKVEEMAKRIQQLEKENAELRAQIQNLQRTVPALQTLVDEHARRPVPQRPPRFDRPELTIEQHKILEEANRLRGQPEPLPPFAVSPPPRAPSARQRQLYLEEADLAQKYLDYVSKQFSAGRTTLEELSRAQRQLFALKREIAGLDQDRAKLKELAREETDLVSRLLKDVQKRIEAGRAPPGQELDLQRELLKLKRELLLLE